jgi:DNA-directed RNA polymerase subunit beta
MTDIRTKAEKFMNQKWFQCRSWQADLYDGKTGQPFNQPVAVGVMTCSSFTTWSRTRFTRVQPVPYSLVTQQPLGGKAQFGGQRFGEMEVWALEAYGAAYTLQEMLTVKSDDVQGRVKTHMKPSSKASRLKSRASRFFRVLVKELQSLGLAVEAEMDTGDVIKFGKDEAKVKPPKLETGLLGLGKNIENLFD